MSTNMKATLKPLETGKAQSAINLTSLPFTIGRDKKCNLCINEPSVFKRHAQIQADNNKFMLKDLGTYEGTYLNGERTVETPLKDGDIIRVGTQKMQFSIDTDSVVPAPRQPTPQETTTTPGLLKTCWQNHRIISISSLILIGLIILVGSWGIFSKKTTALIVPAEIKLAEGEITKVELTQFDEFQIEDESIISAQRLENILLIEGLNAGRTRIQIQQGEDNFGIIKVLVKATTSRIDRYPELKPLLATLNDYDKIQKAESLLQEGNNYYKEKAVDVKNLYLSQQSYDKALILLESIIPHPSIYVTARQKKQAAEEEIKASWDQHFFQLKRAYQLKDYSNAREEANFLLRLIPDPKDKRHQTLLIYWDRLKRR